MTIARLLASCLLVGAVFGARPASAETAGEIASADGARRGGPLLRLRLGPAYVSTVDSRVPDLPEEKYSGVGIAFDVELGRAPTSNFTVCAELSGAFIPSARADPESLLTATPTADLATAALGASFTYTAPPGFYVAVNPGLMTLLVNYHGEDWLGFDLGLEIAFLAGGEWLVSNGWRLGLAAEARYAAMGGAQDLSFVTQYGLFLSATYD